MRKWTKEEIETLIELYNQGATHEEIAAQIQRSVASCERMVDKLRSDPAYQQRLVSTNIHSSKRRSKPYPLIRPYTNTTYMLLAEFLMEGYTVEQIADLLGRDKDDLDKHIQEHFNKIIKWQVYLLKTNPIYWRDKLNGNTKRVV